MPGPGKRFEKGNKASVGKGRRRLTPEEKVLKKAQAELAAEFKEKLRKLEAKALKSYEAALNASVSPRRVVTKKGEVVEVDPGAGELLAGLRAADSISDRVYGPPKQEIEHSGELTAFIIKKG